MNTGHTSKNPEAKRLRKSIVVYRGPSMLDGHTKIRALLVPPASGKGGNQKIGKMNQLFIFVDGNEPPYEAQLSGRDAAVCGDCPLRPANGGGCYVVTAHIRGTHHAWLASRKKPVEAIPKVLHYPLRLGAYGDPAAVPQHILDALVEASEGRVVCYTHQWRRKDSQHLQEYCMASAENLDEAAEAHGKGWRTFRARPEGVKEASDEIDCPWKNDVKCAKCMACGGRRTKTKKHVSIPAHGPKKIDALRVVR